MAGQCRFGAVCQFSDGVVENHWRRPGGVSDVECLWSAHDDNRLETHAWYAFACGLAARNSKESFIIETCVTTRNTTS